MSPRRVVVVALLCALVLAPVTHFPTPSNDHVVNVDPADALREGLDMQRQQPPSVDEPANVILRLKGTSNIPDTAGIDVERTYTRAGDRFVEGSVSYAEIRQLSRDPRITSVSITGTTTDGDTVSPGVSVVGADELHAANVTGEDVTVGVIDSEFRMSHPAIASVDTTYRSFDAGTNWEHGTAVASILADTAPRSDLRLAAVGPTTSPEEYGEAVDWLVDGGADVIVDSGSYYAQPGDGNGTLGRIVANVSEDVVFVTSAGNHANRYWAGNHTEGRWVNFTDGEIANHLNDGEPFAGRVDLSVRWDGWPTTDDDYDIYLVRVRDGARDPIVARTDTHDGQPFEHLSKTVSRGRYYVSVYAKNVSDPHRVELFASHALTNRSTGGTTAPASVPGVITVGAIHNETLQPFSARTNVDLVAPDSVSLSGATIDGGTSFAAPYVAGVAALLVDANPEMNASAVRQHLYENAIDFGVEGIDDGSGYGVVSAAGVLTAGDEQSDDDSDESANTTTTPRLGETDSRDAVRV